MRLKPSGLGFRVILSVKALCLNDGRLFPDVFFYPVVIDCSVRVLRPTFLILTIFKPFS